MRRDDFDTLLAALEGLDEGQKRLVRRALDGQDDMEKVSAALEARFPERPACPRCASARVRRWSREDGLRRFRCLECGRTFNCLTGTPLAHLRRKDCWLRMAEALRSGMSLRKAAAHCGVSLSTAFRWRHRFLATAAGAKPAKLEGVAEADETYFLESFKGGRKLPRPPRRRGGKAGKRGISAEQVGVLVARDRQGRTLDAVLPDKSAASITRALRGCLGEDNVLCVDGGRALCSGLKALGVPCRVVAAGKGKRTRDPFFHVQNVNGYHARLKRWMARFNGVATRYLPSYLGWRRLCELAGGAASELAWLLAALGRGHGNA